MRMYRKFGQGVAVLCCIAMFVLAIAYFFVHGFSEVDKESGEIIYFFEYNDFQGALLVALSFLVSTVANACTVEFPQIATGIAALPLVMTFYEMAVENLNFVLAAVLLLLALIHTASNFIAWYDMHEWKKTHKTPTVSKKESE